MPRTAEQNDKIKLERMNDILAASLKLFSVVGSNNVSVDLITETVNCSHGLFYHYFKNVDDIYKVVLESANKFDFENFNLDDIMDSEGFDGLKKIAEYFGSEKVFNEAFLCYAKIYLQENNPKQILASMMSKRWGVKNATEALALLVSRGQKSGDIINGDPTIIALVIKQFLLAYINDIANAKRKDRKYIDSKILLGFISKKEIN